MFYDYIPVKGSFYFGNTKKESRQGSFAVAAPLRFIWFCGLIAAAAKDENYSKDYDPGAVIVKEMA